MTLAGFGFGQEVPIQNPLLLPFPSVNSGLSYYSLVPSQNLVVSSLAGGWTAQDTLKGLAFTFDLELLRYRWWDHFFAPSKWDAYSSLGYSIFNQMESIELPVSYPASFQLNNSVISEFEMNALITEFYLNNRFAFNYNRRGALSATLGAGLAHLALYQNDAGTRLFESNGLGLHFGLGWKTTLAGQVGERLRLGIDLGYSMRSFDLTQQNDELKLADGSSGAISPIQSISFNTPDLKLSIEFGEALFAGYTPYREPYKLGLVDISIGMGVIDHQTGVTLQFDSIGTSLSIPALATISQNFDLQFFKYNWPFHFIRQSNIDILSGLGIRYWRNMQRTSVPEGWARQLTDGSRIFSGMSFFPKVLDLYLDHELIYPLSPKLHAKFIAGSGFATMTLYENEISDKLIDANGLTWQLGGGLGYTLKGDGSSKVNLGLSFTYLHQSFEIDMNNSNLSPVDPAERIPITYIDLSQPIISLDIGLIFGGSSNAALKAHSLFKQKRYSKALEMQHEMLQLYPDHHNKKAILLQKQMIEDSLVTRYYRDVDTILSQGKLENALALLTQGETPPNEIVANSVYEMKRRLADKALTKAGNALKHLDYDQAEQLILLALKSDPTTVQIAQVLLARSYIIRATILYQAGVYQRSLYWLKQADKNSDRYKMVTTDLRQKIGDGHLDDANAGILKSDRQMVYESMKDAKNLNPILGDIVDKHLIDLEHAMEFVEKQQLEPLKRMALDNLLDDVAGLNPENFNPKIGMKGSLIARYIGPPERCFEEGNYELWVYPRPEGVELWLYLQEGKIERIEYQE
ncbi:MAG: hypothetical protein U9Q77_09250 [Candidatus Marinimicrobia bacterium]|nr:hypothetical protein [Candidatus Neomarinimicrobiota bacterium]